MKSERILSVRCLDSIRGLQRKLIVLHRHGKRVIRAYRHFHMVGDQLPAGDGNHHCDAQNFPPVD
jgi:hypothetical protein